MSAEAPATVVGRNNRLNGGAGNSIVLGEVGDATLDGGAGG